MNKAAKFDFNQYYHIFNRTNNKEDLFHNLENMQYFLRQYKRYLGMYINVHAYALMSNHFHFSVKVKSEEQIRSVLDQIDTKVKTVAINKYETALDKSEVINSLIISQHRRFFISYSQAINKMLGRQGNLFNANFKKSLFNPDLKFSYIQYYIHHNARKHKVVKDFKRYAFTSYHEILDENDWLIDIKEIINRFGSLEEFERFHNQKLVSDWIA